MKAEDMGTTGLVSWVNDAHDMFDYKERLRRGEDIIASRYSACAALVFSRCCNSSAAERRQRISQENAWNVTLERARAWAKDIRDDLVAGRPVSLRVEPRYKHVLELAFDIATGKVAL